MNRRCRGARLGVLVAALVTPACNGSSECGAGPVGFARICVPGGGGPQCPGSFAVPVITGLDRHLVDSLAPPPLRARIAVGERVVLHQSTLGGCLPSPVSVSWGSTRPEVATVALIGTQGSSADFLVHLVGVAPGETAIFADLVYRAGTGIAPYRATLAYCDGPEDSCTAPKAIGVVEVVAAP